MGCTYREEVTKQGLAPDLTPKVEICPPSAREALGPCVRCYRRMERRQLLALL